MASDIPQLPPGTGQAIAGATGMFGSALLSRLLWHHRDTQRHGRRFWTAELLWQLPTALFCTILAYGIESYFGLNHMVGMAVATMLGWIGPGGVQVLLERLLERYAPKPRCEPPKEG